MTVNVPQSKLEYISMLELAEPTYKTLSISSKEPLVLAADGQEAGYVVGGGAISFTPGVSRQHQEDVLNSTLLAQLAANKKFDRENQTREWYDYYRTVLENIAWVVGNFKFSKYDSTASSFTMDKVVLEIIAAIATGGQAEILLATLNALESQDPGSKAITIFNSNGSIGEGGNFQISASTEDPSGNVSLSLGTFYFKSTEHKTSFLFFSWSTQNIQFYTGAESVTLNEVIYQGIRQAVIDKLGEKAKNYVANLEI